MSHDKDTTFMLVEINYRGGDKKERGMAKNEIYLSSLIGSNMFQDFQLTVNFQDTNPLVRIVFSKPFKSST